jgi:asparagine N-glycosylation enzyme membrane subunit Stt3
MSLPPAFEDRNAVEQILGAVVVTMVFGLVTGFALGWNEIVYYVLVGPIALAGGFVGGVEHRGAEQGVLRGAMSGLVYGSFILLGLEILNEAPEAHLGEPRASLVFVTTFVGAILGGLGGGYRMRRERGVEGRAAAGG